MENEQSTIPLSIPENPGKKQKINTIILSGGGIKGLMYPGVLKAIEEYPHIFEIKKIYCISIGSVIGVYWTFGMKTFEYEKMFSLMDPQKHLKFDFYNIMETWGISDPEGWISFGRNILKYKTGRTHCTFAEHFQITGIHMILPLACLSNQKLETFDYINTPNIDIFDAIKASFSIPFVFQPVYINEKLYCDAGLIDNRCCFLLKEHELSQSLLIDFEFEINAEPTSFPEYFTMLTTTLISYSPIPTNINHIRLQHDNTDAFDFNKFTSLWKEYIPIGYQQTIKYIKNELN